MDELINSCIKQQKEQCVPNYHIELIDVWFHIHIKDIMNHFKDDVSMILGNQYCRQEITIHKN